MRSLYLAMLTLTLTSACGSGEPSSYAGLDAHSIRLAPPAGLTLIPGERVTVPGDGFIDDPTRILVRFGTQYVHPDESAPRQLVLTVPPSLEALAGQHVPVQVFISNFRSATVQLPVAPSRAVTP